MTSHRCKKTVKRGRLLICEFQFSNQRQKSVRLSIIEIFKFSIDEKQLKTSRLRKKFQFHIADPSGVLSTIFNPGVRSTISQNGVYAQISVLEPTDSVHSVLYFRRCKWLQLLAFEPSIYLVLHLSFIMFIFFKTHFRYLLFLTDFCW